MGDYERIHNFERFCNKAFDLRNAYIMALIDEAYKRNLSQDVVEIYLETSREDAAELLEYARASNFSFGDVNDGTSSGEQKNNI